MALGEPPDCSAASFACAESRDACAAERALRDGGSSVLARLALATRSAAWSAATVFSREGSEISANTCPAATRWPGVTRTRSTVPDPVKFKPSCVMAFTVPVAMDAVVIVPRVTRAVVSGRLEAVNNGDRGTTADRGLPTLGVPMRGDAATVAWEGVIFGDMATTAPRPGTRSASTAAYARSRVIHDPSLAIGCRRRVAKPRRETRGSESRSSSLCCA